MKSGLLQQQLEKYNDSWLIINSNIFLAITFYSIYLRVGWQYYLFNFISAFNHLENLRIADFSFIAMQENLVFWLLTE